MKIQINRGKVSRPQKVVIYAPEGLGKSSIASQLPNPLFIDLEQGTHHLDVARFEPANLTQVEDLLVALANKKVEGGYKTLVIDTIDWLEELVVKQVCEDGKKNSIEDFGYGKGYTHLAEKMSTLLAKLDSVAAAGMDVVLLAHSQVKKFEAPDDAKAYDRYELKLLKTVGPLIKEWCDTLLFANWKTNVKQPDEGRAKGLGGKERKLYATHTAAWDAKNRHGLKDEEPFTPETLLRILGAGTAPAVTSAPAVGRDDPPSSDAAQQPKPETVETPKPVAPPPSTAPEPEDRLPGFDTPQEQVAKLLGEDTPAAIQWLVKNKHLQDGQGLESLSDTFAARILKRPLEFVTAVRKAA